MTAVLDGLFDVLRRLQAIATDFLGSAGRACLFLGSVLAAVPSALARPRLVAQQVYAVGVLSLVIIVVSGTFIGMVLALQGYRTLVGFGAEESLGVFVALVTVRELGPVVTALLFAGRAGSALAAEIGLMRATDQLSGMEMMAVDPVRRVVAPRFVAGFLTMPLLAAIFSVMAIGVAGGHLMGIVLVPDPGPGRAQGHLERRGQERRVRLRDLVDRGLPGLPRRADLGRRVRRDQDHRRARLAGDPGAGFRPHRLHVRRRLRRHKASHCVQVV